MLDRAVGDYLRRGSEPLGLAVDREACDLAGCEGRESTWDPQFLMKI